LDQIAAVRKESSQVGLLQVGIFVLLQYHLQVLTGLLLGCSVYSNINICPPPGWELGFGENREVFSLYPNP